MKILNISQKNANNCINNFTKLKTYLKNMLLGVKNTVFGLENAILVKLFISLVFNTAY